MDRHTDTTSDEIAKHPAADAGVTDPLSICRALLDTVAGSSGEHDDEILFVGRVVQSVVDRAFGKDSVQIVERFNQKSSSLFALSDGTIPTSIKLEKRRSLKDFGAEPLS